MQHGGDLTYLSCGIVGFDHIAGQQLIAQLPNVLQLDVWSDEDGSWLQSTLRLIAREAREIRHGGGTVITHLADILIRFRSSSTVLAINPKYRFQGRSSASLVFYPEVFVTPVKCLLYHQKLHLFIKHKQ